MKRFLPMFAALPLLAIACNEKPAESTKAPPPIQAPNVPAEVKASTGADEIAVTGENTKITFIGAKPDGKHNGGFNKVDGTIKLVAGKPKKDGEKNSSKLESISVEIDAASIYADNPMLTTHLKSQDFFGVKEYPKITFKSTSISATDQKPDLMQVTGDLTIRGTTKSITFSLNYPAGKAVYLFGDFEINRKDFGMIYGAGKIDDVVKVKVIVGKPEAAAAK